MENLLSVCMKTTIIMIFWVFISPIGLAGSEKFDSVEIFQSGNKAYQSGDFKGAIEFYDKLLKNGVISGTIYYNLANSYFRSGELGKTIFYYRQAIKYIPRDPDLLFSLNYARLKTEDKIEPHQSFFSKILEELQGLSLNESKIIFVSLSFLFWTFLTINFFLNRNYLNRLSVFFLIFYVFSIFIISYKSFGDDHYGVIISKKAKIYSGTGKNNINLFSLSEGCEFKVIDQSNGWIRLQLADNKQGWIESSQVLIDSN